MIDAFPDAIMVLDSHDNILCINEPAVELFRLRTSSDRGQAVTSLFPDVDFSDWLAEQEKLGRTFTPEQMEWLRMLKDHVVSSYHIEIDDLDYTPFDSKGGKGKMYQLFGAEMNEIIEELNEILAA